MKKFLLLESVWRQSAYPIVFGDSIEDVVAKTGIAAESFREVLQGWPKYYWDNGGVVIYQLVYPNGTVHKAYVDSSTQYQADGLRWRLSESGQYAPYVVMGYLEEPFLEESAAAHG